MGQINEDIKKQLGAFAEKFGPQVIMPGVVTAVNEDDTVVVKFSDDSEVDDCRLKAVVKAGNKVLLIPKVGSVVLVGRIANSDEMVVLSVDEVSEVQYLIGTTKFSVNEDGFLVQKGTDTLKQVLQLQNEAMQNIVVIYGNNPDYVKLAEAATKLNNLLR